jgi:hypothetical protein
MPLACYWLATCGICCHLWNFFATFGICCHLQKLLDVSILPLAQPYCTCFSHITHHKTGDNSYDGELAWAWILPSCRATGRQLGPLLLGPAEVLLGFNTLIRRSFANSSASWVSLRLPGATNKMMVTPPRHRPAAPSAQA